MKPNFDLKNPLVQSAISHFKKTMEFALRVDPKVENSVIPIFAVLDSDAKNQGSLQQIASGVVVKIKNDYFVFSASHVFDDIGEFQLSVGGGDNDEILSLVGDRFSTKKGKSGTHKDDPIDASVYHIQSTISERLKNISLTLADFDFSNDTKLQSLFFASGFRANKSKRSGNHINSKHEVFPSIEISEKEYLDFSIDPNFHIALASEKEVLIHGRWHLAPKLAGISGGAIIRISNLSMNAFPTGKEARQLLTAITIEKRPEHKNQMGLLIGTRISVHLGLIEQFLPGLLDGDFSKS